MKKHLTTEKLQDIRKLLQAHYGENWYDNSSLKWYRELLEAPEERHDENDDELEFCECDCLVNEKAVLI